MVWFTQCWTLLIQFENIRKRLVFLYFQEVQKEKTDMKWVNKRKPKLNSYAKRVIQKVRLTKNNTFRGVLKALSKI